MTTTIEVNYDTYTEVLNGEGFVYSEDEIEYFFSLTQPTGRGFKIPPKNQVSSSADQKLWAKSTSPEPSFVSSNPEA